MFVRKRRQSVDISSFRYVPIDRLQPVVFYVFIEVFIGPGRDWHSTCFIKHVAPELAAARMKQFKDCEAFHGGALQGLATFDDQARRIMTVT